MIYKAVTTVIDQARETGLMREKTRVPLFTDYTYKIKYARLYPFL